VVVLKQGVSKATLEQVVAECNKTKSGGVDGNTELTVHEVAMDNEGIVVRKEISDPGDVALESYLKSEKR
jgi:hypothetical protein